MAGVDKLHIVMYPWLAIGHITPFFKLAKLIAQKGHYISFVSTSKNIDRLPKLPPNLSSLIKFVKLPLPKVDKLPDNAESTTDVPLNLVQYLKKANDDLEEPLIRFLESSNPDVIIHDFCSYWVGSIASKMGIKSSFFCTFNAAAMAFLGSPTEMMGIDPIRQKPEDLTVPPPWIPFPTTVAYHLHDVKGIMELRSQNDSGVSDGYRTGASIRNCDIVTIRSSYEFEAEWLQVLENIYQKPVFPVGELPTYDDNDGEENDTWQWVKDWLDKQRKGTVLYMAFGTEAKMNQQEVTEIAVGLEKSEVPFFWVLRIRSGSVDSDVLKLPDGFEERSRGRGVVWNAWAPQPKILAHESVGGFWTHGGWSSVVEGIQNGKPLVLLTFQLDQGLNARLLEEKKVGYSIPRDEHDGSFTSDDVTKSLRLIMVEEEGRIYREKTKEMKDSFVDKEKQDGYVDKLLGYFIGHNNAEGVFEEEGMGKEGNKSKMKREGRRKD